jgi:hypothetical protein
MLVLTSFTIIGAVPVVSEPLGMTIAPRVAAAFSTVTVSGAGCSSDVDVVETPFLFGTPPEVVSTQTVTPSAGAWSSTFPMPRAPAFVIATCDGVSSTPIVVAPNDVATGSMSYAAVTPTDIQITTSPLFDGSEFSIFDRSGNELGHALARFGTATVRIPRSAGPAQVIAVGLRQHDPGIDLPYVPFALEIQLPPSSSPSIIVEPAVTTSGSPVSASGRCSGSGRLLITGGATGWYDTPPVYVDETLSADAAGNWMSAFVMPPTASTASVLCTQGPVTETAAVLIAPADGLEAVTGQPDGTGLMVTLPNVISPERLVAFTATGSPVPLSIEALLTNGIEARLEPPWIPVRVVIIGIRSFGENAMARQVSGVQGWSVDFGTITEGASTAGLAPAERLSASLPDVACCPQPAVRIRP